MSAAARFLHAMSLALATPWAAALFRNPQHWKAMVSQPAGTAVELLQGQGGLTRLQAPARGGNNCAQGKLLPEFYLLGAKKAGTTSLSVDLRSAGVVPAPAAGSKEWNFFHSNGQLPDSEEQRHWMRRLMDCPAKPTVMADFSVANLFHTPMPSEWTWSQDLGYLPKFADYFEVPRMLAQFHAVGGAVPKFVILLREPISRLQSEYYHTQWNGKNCHGCRVNGTFVDSFATNVGLLQHQPPEISDWFWKSFYARQIEAYLRYFDGKQFFFAPNKEYFSINPSNFSTSLLEWLHIRSEPWTEASHILEHPKPHLDEELPPGAPSRTAFEAFMAPETERLARALARAHGQGAILAGYAGPRGDVAAVQGWLVHAW